MAHDEGRLAGYSGYERAISLFDVQLGEETRDDRHEHAPDERHPNVEEER